MVKKAKRERTIPTVEDAAPEAEQPKAESSPADEAFKTRCSTLETEIAQRSVALVRLQVQVKAEKDALNRVVQELADLEQRGPERLPLFDGVKPEWRGLPICTLKLNGKIEEKLVNAGHETMGSLFDLMQAHGIRWAEPVPGIGPELAIVVADAWATFWQEHPEYSAEAQEELA